MEVYQKQQEYESLDRKFSGFYEYALVDGEGMITICNVVDEVVEVPAEIDGVKITSIYYNAFLSCGSKTIILPESASANNWWEITEAQYEQKQKELAEDAVIDGNTDNKQEVI
jgi:hypothetical protein